MSLFVKYDKCYEFCIKQATIDGFCQSRLFSFETNNQYFALNLMLIYDNT